MLPEGPPPPRRHHRTAPAECRTDATALAGDPSGASATTALAEWPTGATALAGAPLAALVTKDGVHSGEVGFGG